MRTILVVDDDERLRNLLTEYLGGRGFAVEAVPDGESAISRTKSGGLDLVVLDIMLPGKDGLEVCREVRGHSQVPIIMLTARGDETDRIVGLELGADDYLPKPFNPRELLARIRAVLRRRNPLAGRGAQRPPLRFGRLAIDRDARLALRDGEPCNLTSHQFELLRILAENAGRAVSRDSLMEQLRGNSITAFDRSIDVHVSRIRAAIEDDPRKPKRLLTVRGVGYLFARNQDGEVPC